MGQRLEAARNPLWHHATPWRMHEEEVASMTWTTWMMMMTMVAHSVGCEELDGGEVSGNDPEQSNSERTEAPRCA